MKQNAVPLNPLTTFLECLTGTAVFILPVSKAAAEVFFISALCCWLLGKIFLKSSPFSTSRVTLLYGLFFGTTVLSLTQIPHSLIPNGLQGILKWTKYLGLFFMCMEIYADPRRQSRLFGIFVASMFLVSLNGFWQLQSGKDLFFGYGLDPGRIVRMKSSFGAPNLLASFLLFGISLAVFFFYGSRSWRRAVYGGLFLLFSASLLLTYSRGAFYALMFSLLLNLIFLKKARTALALMVLGAALLWIVPSFRYNFVQTLKQKDITIVERSKFWNVAWHMIKENPLLGVGVNTYYARSQNYSEDVTIRKDYPHNSYLQMTSEIGVFGVLFFIAAIFYTLASSLKTNRGSDPSPMIALRIPLFAFLLQSFFDTNFYALQTASLFWVFWGVFSGFVFHKKTIS